MDKLFDLGELGKCQVIEPIQDKSAVLRDKFLDMHSRQVETLKELAGQLPAENEFLAIWTMKSFNAFTFIPYLIMECGKIDRLVMSTYSINRRIIDSLIKKIDQGKIEKVSLLISDSLRQRMPLVSDHLQSMAKLRPQIIVNYAWNHSKITLAEAAGKYFVVEGSGNWSENAQFEQYLFFNNKKLFDFRLECISHGTEPGTN